MKILFIAPDPPNHLTRIRMANILTALARRHDVHLVHLDPGGEPLGLERVPVANMTGVRHSRLRSYLNCLLRLPLPEPLEAAYCYSPAMARTVRRLLAEERPDVVYVKRTRMARYGLGLHGVRSILDLTDSMEVHYSRTWRTVEWYKRPLYVEEWLKYRRYERQVLGRYDLCLVASSIDRDYIRAHSGAGNIRLVPNIVDVERFHPRPLPSEPATLMFSGLMHKQVNIDAARFLLDEILPRVRHEMPGARLLVVGPRPPAGIRSYERRDPGIRVTGYVPDIGDYIARSTVVLAPVRAGAGTRNKILQAMAMGKAVVSTTVGAEGLEGLSPENIRIADSPADFAHWVLALLRDGDLRSRLGEEGRRLVRERYSLDALQESLEAVLSELASGSAAPARSDT